MADSTDLMARGLEVTGKLWGARAGGQELPAQKLAPEFVGLVAQFVFGCSGRDRTSICAAAACARSRSWPRSAQDDELRAHLAGALNLGIRREELIEVLMQTACYAGCPPPCRR